MIPDTPDYRRNIYINDYNRMRSAFDLLLTGPKDESLKAVERGLLGIDLPYLGEDAYFSPLNMYFTAGNWDTDQNSHYLALEYGNMEQSIVAPGKPVDSSFDSRLEVIQGTFASGGMEAAIKGCSECPEPRLNEHRGVSYYGWGDDYVTNDELKLTPPVFDYWGRGGHVTTLKSRVLRTFGEREMETLIDMTMTDVESLADVEEFRVLAQGIYELGAYAMYLTDNVELWALDEYRKALEAGTYGDHLGNVNNTGPWLRPFDAFAVGVGEDEGGAYMALTLLHSDDVSATDNVGLLRRIIEEERSALTDTPWSEHFDVNRLDIRAEGNILLAKLGGLSPPSVWIGCYTTPTASSCTSRVRNRQWSFQRLAGLPKLRPSAALIDGVDGFTALKVLSEIGTDISHWLTPSTSPPAWCSAPTTASPAARSSVPGLMPTLTAQLRLCVWQPTPFTAPTRSGRAPAPEESPTRGAQGNYRGGAQTGETHLLNASVWSGIRGCRRRVLRTPISPESPALSQTAGGSTGL